MPNFYLTVFLYFLFVAMIYCLYHLLWFRLFDQAVTTNFDNTHALLNAVSKINRLLRWPLILPSSKKGINLLVKGYEDFIQSKQVEATIDKLRQEDTEQP